MRCVMCVYFKFRALKIVLIIIIDTTLIILHTTYFFPKVFKIFRIKQYNIFINTFVLIMNNIKSEKKSVTVLVGNNIFIIKNMYF